MGAIKVPTDTMSREGKENDENLEMWAALPRLLGLLPGSIDDLKIFLIEN